MTKLVYTHKFVNSYKKYCKRKPMNIQKLDNSLKLLAGDIHNALLVTHKLKGDLIGLNACSCGFDCRIIFKIVTNKETSEEYILLIDIGTHEEVY